MLHSINLQNFKPRGYTVYEVLFPPYSRRGKGSMTEARMHSGRSMTGWLCSGDVTGCDKFTLTHKMSFHILNPCKGKCLSMVIVEGYYSGRCNQYRINTFGLGSITMESVRILVEGVGGIGGVVAGKLMQAGYEPTLVTGNREIGEAINQRGLTVIEPGAKFTVAARAFASLAELPPESRFDIALLVMKAHSVVQAASDTARFLKPQGGFVVTCQNGIVQDAVAEAIGRDRVVAGIIGWGGTMHGPGVVERTGPGAIHLGEPDGAKPERLENLARMLRVITPVVVTDNIRGAQWCKLAINCTITTIGALAGESLGHLLKDERGRRAFLGIYREVIDTALALGVRLERIAVDPMLLYVPSDASFPTRFFKDLLVRIVGRKYGRLKSSSLQSLERGRRTEIDFLNGYVVEQAGMVGVHAYLNESVTRMIKEIEQGQRRLSPANIE
jgi:2-dehydropantoate 2-reductase